ncbi:MAG: DUF255 domain-containing protein, partial [Pseudomonadota bacterium]|nr:DUF255 domain-containing protein [Pseudomonadota bacterium]
LLSNQLAGHPSPYLALHGGDPVAWQSWNEDALAVARKENRLLFLSVGYFSCHWCHVMQRESYRDRDIASLVNRHFVPVKVDRELEPALDKVLMDFAYKTVGRGGWPLNVFVTPEGYPLYAVLYQPPEQFRNLLEQLSQLWEQDGERLSEIARQSGPARFPDPGGDVDATLVATLNSRFVDAALSAADDLDGGFGVQAKFPHTPQLDYLIEAYDRQPRQDLKDLLTLSLDNMAYRGLVDHLSGGFFRYTVDPGWEVPHFEKMLYTNALLARTYLRSAAILGRPEYSEVARRTLDFMAARMRTPGGGLIAAFSAVDDQGAEGAYYLWTESERADLLSVEEHEVLTAAWSLDRPPEFQTGHHLNHRRSVQDVAADLAIPVERVKRLLAQAMGRLLEARGRRTLPADSKILAGWNGLALSAFTDAARALGEPRYLETARGIRNYLARVCWDGKHLHRSIAGSRALGTASLQDYAYVAAGLLAWAELTGEAEDFRLVRTIITAAWERFFIGNGWRLTDQALLATDGLQETIPDGVLPSPAAVLSLTTLQLGDLELQRLAARALNRAYDQVSARAFYFPTQILALERLVGLARD